MSLKRPRPAASYRILTYLQAAYVALVPLAAGLGSVIHACGVAGWSCPPALLTLGGMAAPVSILSLCLSSLYLIPLGALTVLMGLKLASTADAVGDRSSARRLRWHLLIPLGTIAASVSALALLIVSGVVVLVLPSLMAWV
jgi:hypothetical protein